MAKVWNLGLEDERRLRSIAAYIARYEKENGLITAEERAAKREARLREIMISRRRLDETLTPVSPPEAPPRSD